MKKRKLIVGAGLTPLLCALACQAPKEVPTAPEGPAIQSTLTNVGGDHLILLQEVRVEAPIAAVWDAFTTKEGWEMWAVPTADVDLRPGGTIRTNYTPGASIGDPGTNTLHILNYVPERVLTLQADVAANWPEVMQADGENLMNVILFESLGPERTRILSYGVGYRDLPEYKELMNFFIPANEGLYAVLKEKLEG